MFLLSGVTSQCKISLVHLRRDPVVTVLLRCVFLERGVVVALVCEWGLGCFCLVKRAGVELRGRLSLNEGRLL